MLLYIFTFLVVIFLISPIIVLVPISFTSLSYFKFPPPSFSTQWYESFIQNDEWMKSFFKSLELSCVVVILSVIIGTIAALAVSRVNFKFKKAFMALMVTPMIIPIVIIGVALLNSFAKIGLNDTMTGLMIAHTLIAVPIVFVTIMSGLKGLDRNIELAATGLGSTEIGVFFKIMLPQLKSSMMSACLFAFITSFDEVSVTLFLAGTKTKTLPVAMWETMRTELTPTLAAVSSILISLTIIMFVFQNLFNYRLKNKYTRVSDK